MFIFHPGFNPKTDKGMFDKDAHAIVNTVNCIGTSENSAGIAGETFRRFPDVHRKYLSMCRSGKFFPGAVQPPIEVNPKTRMEEKGTGVFVVNVATKDHYRNDSKLEWVSTILDKMERVVEETGAKTVALPPLGCGHGGLDWKKDVGPMVKEKLAHLVDKGVTFYVFAEDPSPGLGKAKSVMSKDNRKDERDIMPPAPPKRSSLDEYRQRRADPRQASLNISNPSEAPKTEFSKPENPTYAGIGARPFSTDNPTGAPQHVLDKMILIGEAMAKEGWTLRSGGAKGSDESFEAGASRVKGAKMEIYLPLEIDEKWKAFNGRKHDGVRYFAAQSREIQDKAIVMARRLHPAKERLQGFALKAMARNAHQMTGHNLDSKSDVLIGYTQNGQDISGTGQSLRMAREIGIPIINLGDPKWANRSVEEIVSAAKLAREGKDPLSLFESQKPTPAREAEPEKEASSVTIEPKKRSAVIVSRRNKGMER